ncbi:MAG TPA: hypothetical protein VMS77_06880 [Conexivisphaerales archaeon]|nr:hypothetical protein [Conexivisphaerales archaeon]
MTRMEIIPQFFALMGSLITVFFFATVWYWMKYSELANGGMRGAAKWTMTGCSFLLMASWFICGMSAYPGYALRPEKANYAFAIPISYVAMILLVLGFAFLLGQLKAYLTKSH